MSGSAAYLIVLPPTPTMFCLTVNRLFLTKFTTLLTENNKYDNSNCFYTKKVLRIPARCLLPGSMHDDLDVGAAPSRDAAGQPRARVAPVTGGGSAATAAAATAASPRR